MNEFVVYKNKDDGQRALRYRGTDEAYAVNELYLKLKDEILNQKAHNQDRRSRATNSSSTNNTGGYKRPTTRLSGITTYGFDYSDSKWDSSVTKFEDSSYYEEHYESSDSDSDFDWDSGDSWDSNDSDWDSDW